MVWYRKFCEHKRETYRKQISISWLQNNRHLIANWKFPEFQKHWMNSFRLWSVQTFFRVCRRSYETWKCHRNKQSQNVNYKFIELAVGSTFQNAFIWLLSLRLLYLLIGITLCAKLHYATLNPFYQNTFTCFAFPC